jgi:uncharacterized protein (TIGR00255 family)
MTGFGKATVSFGDKKITAEIKSLNSKQFDLSVKTPTLYREKEFLIRNILSEILGRGKVDFAIYTESSEGEKRAVINDQLALGYLRDLSKIAKAAGIQTGDGLLSTVLNLPDVIQTERPELDEAEWERAEKAVRESAQSLMDFRRNEGTRLAEDISQRIKLIEKLRLEVETHLDERLQQVRSRIEKNIADLLTEEQTDKNRMEQEIIYYLEKLDITEEHTRLKGHCDYFLETMNADEASGKKLGFISQEIGREINTMGSKANHVGIQKLVVQMKDELEKIKEQLLNIN